MTHPVRELALAFADAHELTLPRVTGRYRFTEREVKAYVFPQTWPTSAHGLDRPGEVEPTEVYTVIMLATIEYAAAVYFEGVLAYAVNLKDEVVREHFLESLRARHIPSIQDAKERYGESFIASQVHARRTRRKRNA